MVTLKLLRVLIQLDLFGLRLRNLVIERFLGVWHLYSQFLNQ